MFKVSYFDGTSSLLVCHYFTLNISSDTVSGTSSDTVSWFWPNFLWYCFWILFKLPLILFLDFDQTSSDTVSGFCSNFLYYCFLILTKLPLILFLDFDQTSSDTVSGSWPNLYCFWILTKLPLILFLGFDQTSSDTELCIIDNIDVTNRHRKETMYTLMSVLLNSDTFIFQHAFGWQNVYSYNFV